MTWKLGSVPRTAHDYEYEVDGFKVRTNLSPEELAGWTEKRRAAFLRRILRNTPHPQRTEEAS